MNTFNILFALPQCIPKNVIKVFVTEKIKLEFLKKRCCRGWKRRCRGFCGREKKIKFLFCFLSMEGFPGPSLLTSSAQKPQQQQPQLWAEGFIETFEFISNLSKDWEYLWNIILLHTYPNLYMIVKSISILLKLYYILSGIPNLNIYFEFLDFKLESWKESSLLKFYPPSSPYSIFTCKI